MLYKNLSDSEKVAIRKALNAKRALARAEKKLAQAQAEIFDLVKANGEVVKGGEKIMYRPTVAPSLVVKSSKLEIAYPSIFAELAEPNNGRAEHLAYTVKKG